MTQQVQKRNAQMVDLLRQDFQHRREPNYAWSRAVSMCLGLPVRRASWSMAGNYIAGGLIFALDDGGVFVLQNINNAQFGYDSLAPYIEFDGVNQYLFRADPGAGGEFDITGAEVYIVAAQRGLTLGGWFRFDNAAAANEMMLAKDDVAPNRGYFTRRNAAGTCRFGVSVDGNALTSVDSVATVGASVWTFIVGRFIPSTSLDIFVNSALASNVAAIPASIFDSVADFKIGAVRAVPTFFMDGRASMCFICAAQLSDAVILSLYEQTRAMYGV